MGAHVNDGGSTKKRSWPRIALWVIGALVAVFILIQFIPYGRDHSNPPATNPFVWSAPGAEAIAKTSCYDCHSNETNWWWAVKIAPFSWLAWNDISGGRENLNFSEWNGGLSAEELQQAINGEMPPLQYTLLHPNAKLSDQEKRTLVSGFEASLAAQSGGSSSAAPSPSPTPAGGDAVALINDRCGVCHSAGVAQEYRAASEAEAQALIDSMVQRGANLTSAEARTLVQYFTR